MVKFLLSYIYIYPENLRSVYVLNSCPLEVACDFFVFLYKAIFNCFRGNFFFFFTKMINMIKDTNIYLGALITVVYGAFINKSIFHVTLKERKYYSSYRGTYANPEIWDNK